MCTCAHANLHGHIHTYTSLARSWNHAYKHQGLRLRPQQDFQMATWTWGSDTPFDFWNLLYMGHCNQDVGSFCLCGLLGPYFQADYVTPPPLPSPTWRSRVLVLSSNSTSTPMIRPPPVPSPTWRSRELVAELQL